MKEMVVCEIFRENIYALKRLLQMKVFQKKMFSTPFFINAILIKIRESKQNLKEVYTFFGASPA